MELQITIYGDKCVCVHNTSFIIWTENYFSLLNNVCSFRLQGIRQYLYSVITLTASNRNTIALGGRPTGNTVAPPQANSVKESYHCYLVYIQIIKVFFNMYT